MDQATAVQVMLYLAAALQVAAAVVALLLIPISGMRKSWLVVCAALALQALRRIDAVTSRADMREAVTALAVSLLLLAGIIGIRAVFVSLRRNRTLLDAEVTRSGVVTNRAGAAIIVLEPDGRIREVNESARALLGGDGQAIDGLDWFDTFVGDDVRSGVRAAFERLVSSSDGNDEYVEYPITGFDGMRHSIVWHRRLLRNADGTTTGVRSAGIDLTDSTTLERDLAFRSILLDHTNDSVLVYRLDGTVVYANSTACEYRGVTREDLIGADVRRFIPIVDRDAFAVHLETVARGSCVKYETEATDRDGIARPLESHVCPVSLSGESLVVDVARDITDRREVEAAIRRLAYTDHLTGLANRVRLEDRASLSIARARRTGESIALLFMDLDRIKAVNDTLGHVAGDDLLRQVGERLSGLYREEDTVARIGGDEFVAFARVAGVSDAEAMAERIVAVMAEPFVIGGEEVLSSASVGVALYPEHGDDLDTLIAKADAAMYVAKDRGRDGFALYHPGFDADAVDAAS